jgi:hypothetical protein
MSETTGRNSVLMASTTAAPPIAGHKNPDPASVPTAEKHQMVLFNNARLFGECGRVAFLHIGMIRHTGREGKA